jgi:hypothetical protein
VTKCIGGGGLMTTCDFLREGPRKLRERNFKGIVSASYLSLFFHP